jgi:hypothetical protein
VLGDTAEWGRRRRARGGGALVLRAEAGEGLAGDIVASWATVKSRAAVDCGPPPIALRCSPLAGSERRGAIRVGQRFLRIHVHP